MLLMAVVVWLAAAPLVSTQPLPAPQPSVQPAPGPGRSQPTPVPPAKPESYAYNAEGRRDPFISLLGRGGEDLRSGAPRPDGLAGLLVNELALRGIVRSQGGYVAIIQSPDNRTYIVRPADRLFDGTVKAITSDAVVFMQEVNDPLTPVKQREVRKPLRVTEEGR